MLTLIAVYVSNSLSEAKTDYQKTPYVLPVEYKTDRPQIKISDFERFIISTRKNDEFMMNEEEKLRILDDFCLTKSLDWSYEKEWRSLKIGIEMGYSIFLPYRVSAIYFGIKCPDSFVERCKEIANRNINYYRCNISRDKYKIEFEII